MYLIIAMIGGTLDVGPGALGVTGTMAIMIPWIGAQWEEYHSGLMLYGNGVIGITEVGAASHQQAFTLRATHDYYHVLISEHRFCTPHSQSTYIRAMLSGLSSSPAAHAREPLAMNNSYPLS